MSDEPRSGRDSVNFGVLLGILLHLLQIVLIPAVSVVVPTLYPKAGFAGIMFAIMGWSVTQFIYMGPAIAIARRTGRNDTAKGLILVAAIGVLLNGACDALFFGLARLGR
jgi:hypothetical protein